MQRTERIAIPNIRGLQVAALFLLALVFGGGGSGAGIFNLVVQLAALAIMALNGQALLDFFRLAPRPVAVLVGVAMLLPVLQCIPLPPAIWQSLPGRDLAADALQLVGKQGDWFPMSLNVQRTIVAALALLPPLAILSLSWNLPEDEKRTLLLMVAVAGVAIVLLGAQQLATGNRYPVFYDEAFGTSDLQGTFANRNSAGLFLNIALCALIGSFPDRPKAAWWLGGLVIGVLLVAGLVLTRSRSSMALVFIPLLLVTVRVWQSRVLGKLSGRSIAAAALGLVAICGLAAGFAAQNERVLLSFSRFDDLQDARPFIWSDTVTSIRHFWPVGSGIGTFDEVFQIDETLEYLGPGRAGRAHNDYLEAALESGVVGIAMIIGWAFVLVAGSVRAVRQGGIAMVPAAVFALLALQSVLDYPLRNETLLCLAGLMLALMIQVFPSRSAGNGGGRADLGS